MGVLVKGMDMPRHCGECGIDWCYIWRKLIRDETPIGTRPSDCPLVEVPTPHGRLIDADAFENFIRKDWDKNDHWIADVVYSRPTIIEAEESE